MNLCMQVSARLVVVDNCFFKWFYFKLDLFSTYRVKHRPVREVLIT